MDLLPTCAAASNTLPCPPPDREGGREGEEGDRAAAPATRRPQLAHRPTRGRSPAARLPAPVPRARASAAAPREGLRRDAVASPGPSSRPTSRPRRRPREDPRRRPPLLRLPRLRRELASSSRPQLLTASSASGRPDANSGRRSRMKPGRRGRRMRRRPRTDRDEGAAGAHFWIANSQIYPFLRPFFGSP